ncbi:MAG: M43 family zinc metalloprotease [Kofleriaceae bacterium]
MAPLTISGTVVEVHSHWTSGGERIVTESTIEAPDGTMTIVTQVGGTADGLGQVVFDSIPLLSKGMIVDTVAHTDFDLSGIEHTVLDAAKIRSLPLGFVRTGPTKAGNYLYWESGCIYLHLDQAGTKEIPGDQEFGIVDTCIETWNDDTASCSYLKVIDAGKGDYEVNGKDYTNVLKFRDASWCRPATKDDPAKCYSDQSAGITTATFVDDGGMRDGAIVDADIEINGVNFAISDNGTTLGTDPCQAELANTLTHELGHLHGLEHTCLASGDPPRVDGNGNAVPDCAETSNPDITEATMYPFQDCGETKKESLSEDDIDAICTIYPTAQDPGTCDEVSKGGGCCDAGGGPASPLALSALTLLVLKTRRRR